mmetsp:Transcript_17849/g.49956  ORF Transcript_17849/g.49956 Transcript_17849/m.49956 type:complete len:255 (+) Transcript_17849:432-1196(+)
MRSLSPVSRARLMVSADILPAPTSTSAAAMIRTILNRKFSPSTFSSSSSGPLSSVISIFVTVRTVVPSRRELLLVSRKARKSCVPTSSPAAERMATISRRKDSPAAGRRLFEAHHRRPTHHWNCLFIGSGVILQHILYIYRFPRAEVFAWKPGSTTATSLMTTSRGRFMFILTVKPWVSNGNASGSFCRSRWQTCPLECTPESVLEAPTTTTRWGSGTRKTRPAVASSSPWTVGAGSQFSPSLILWPSWSWNPR